METDGGFAGALRWKGKEMKQETQISLHAKLAMALGALCVVIALCAVPRAAQAEGDDLSELQQKVEATAQEYDNAEARIAELESDIAENQAKIEEINAQLPGQTESAADSLRVLYIVQQEGGSLLEVVLGSEDLSDFISRVEYLDRISSHNTAQLQRLADSKAALETTQAELDAALDDVKQEAARAARALESAKAARQEAEEKAAAKAAQEAAAAAAQSQADRQQAQAASSATAAAEAKGVDSENASVNVSEEPSSVEGSVDAESVDWSADKKAFVNQWTGRIDDYLAGSALAGQGEAFAEAAWDYGVDPRWSPAIAYVESSLGSYCFRPHNAWGWGSSSWGSWEEAINAHVSGLARRYGSTLTLSAAQMYCPPSYTDWYNKVLNQMNQI